VDDKFLIYRRRKFKKFLFPLGVVNQFYLKLYEPLNKEIGGILVAGFIGSTHLKELATLELLILY